MNFAIIGTRNATPSELTYIEKISYYIAKKGHRVITGGADGVDHASMVGASQHAPDMVTVVLPWATYNNHYIQPGMRINEYHPTQHTSWTQSVYDYHPNPSKLTQGAFKLHARNFGIIEHADVVIALPGVEKLGGTGQGMRIAVDLNKRLFNIRRKDHRQALKQYLMQL